MIGSHSWFHGQINERLARLRAERAFSLAQGAASDFADYRYGVGYLDGLQVALDIADELKKEQDAG